MDFQHVDVFADTPFTGNGLTVFLADGAVQTTFDGTVFRAVLDQGRPEYGPLVTSAAVALVLDGLGLCAADLVPGLEPAVVSTGLRYLVIPVSAPALARAAIAVPDFAGRPTATGAQFAYLLDPDAGVLALMQSLHR